MIRKKINKFIEKLFIDFLIYSKNVKMTFMKNHFPTVLCILDGFGINPDFEGNAILSANPKNFINLWNRFPHTQLYTHGERVGLPAGQMGNSEVGHMNIGAGRVVEQWLVRISRILREDGLPKINSYVNFLEESKNSDAIHIIGLVSNGGVHSHINHLIELIKRLRKDTDKKICIHAITDGRDTSPTSGKNFLKIIEEDIKNYSNVKIVSAIGRYYAMDRDKRWERTKKAYDLFFHSEGEKFNTTASEALENRYSKNNTDEFLEPISFADEKIKENDSVIFFNFRDDRMRQVVSALSMNDFKEFKRDFVVKPKSTLCFTEYDRTFGLPFIFEAQDLKKPLGEVVSNAGLTQARIAETEKYPHVTFFLNGGVEDPYPGESRTMIPSPREVKTYDLKPEMSADGVCKAVLDKLQEKNTDLIVVNFANCDMVGHTGILEAAVKATLTVDNCLGKIEEKVKSQNGVLVVIADHGNAEQMINYSDGSPHTAHTTFPVPMIIIDHRKSSALKVTSLLENGALCDVAPTILKILDIPQPKEMLGISRF